MSGRMNNRVVQLSLILLLGGAPLGYAANPTQPAEINANDLNILEHRFFSHGYAHDPVEKRLERLECLVYGSSRDGSNAERLSRLMKTVALRSQQPLAQEKLTPAPANTGAGPVAKAPASSKQYPILNTLEWKALKKTYPNESLDQRLDRLESKMFGQPAQTMAYIDRVERLKKTVGIGISAEPNDGITAQGPKPKARPQGEDGGSIGGFSGREIPMPMESFVPPSMNFGMNFDMDPFGGTTFGALRPFQQLMQTMDKQMMEMRRLGPGTWVQDPKTKDYVEINSGRRVSPNGLPGSPPLAKPKTSNIPLPIAPESRQDQIREIPGYADPNSI